MLDKSIEYKNIIMKISADKITKMQKPVLSDGFSYRFFEVGDEEHWARIETSVLEFATVDEARDYFEATYLPHFDELQKRCIFIVNKDGLPIATANSWYADSELGHQASLHWVSVDPEYQGLGLGKAVTQLALVNFQTVEPNCSVLLHTQTWSHVAVKLYHRLGFNMMKAERLANSNTRNGIPKIYQNKFEEAMTILKQVMTADDIKQLLDTAE